MQHFRGNMNPIELEENTIGPEVLNSFRVTIKNFRFPLGASDPSALHETVIAVPAVGAHCWSREVEVQVQGQAQEDYLLPLRVHRPDHQVRHIAV